MTNEEKLQLLENELEHLTGSLWTQETQIQAARLLKIIRGKP